MGEIKTGADAVIAAGVLIVMAFGVYKFFKRVVAKA